MFGHRVKLLAKFAILAVCAFAGGACVTVFGGGARAQGAGQGDKPYAAIEQLGRVLVEVENEYVDPVDRAKLVDGAIAGMVSQLDPHSSYMSPDEFRSFESDTQGAFGGIGIEVENRNDQLIVLAPIEGSPADRAGILPGDRIVTVEGQDPTSLPLDKLVKRLRGAPGSHVRVSIRRQGQPDAITFDLVREVIHVASVASKLLTDRVAYVRIKQFQEHTHDELLAAASRLRARAGGKLAGILLDLRGDPGGLVDEASDVADEFLEGGVIYSARHRGQIVDEVKARAGGVFVHEPCIVLVNQWTASASELVAGALQDHQRASVVGEPTFGKGSVQAILSLPGGAGMRLTVSRYYTPSGHAIQADGVHPDILVQAFKQDAPLSYREKDLEGHLAAESRSTQEGRTPKWVVVGGDAGASTPEAGGSEARNVPFDPQTGADGVLKIAWQTLQVAMHHGSAPSK